jgi:hypothetical protein
MKPQDYDAGNHTLLIQASKFHKCRILPLPDDVAKEVDKHLQALPSRAGIRTDLTNYGWAVSCRLIAERTHSYKRIAEIQQLGRNTDKAVVWARPRATGPFAAFVRTRNPRWSNRLAVREDGAALRLRRWTKSCARS